MAFPGVELFAKNIYTDNHKAFEAVYGKKKKLDDKESKPQAIDNLFVSMRGYLIFGRILGVIPISGLIHGNSYTALTFRKLSFPGVINICISTIVGFSTLMAVIQTAKLSKSNALDIAQSIQGTVFLMWGLYGYVYFLLNAESFINIFKTWENSTLYCTSKDETLRRDIIIISVAIFISTLIETTLNHLEYFPQFDQINGMNRFSNRTMYASALETYYWRSSGHWGKHLGYHPVLAILAFTAHKFVLACWNYVDVIMVIFARALYFKFKSLCVMAEQHLNVPSDKAFNLKVLGIPDQLIWTHIVQDHDTLCTLLEALEKFLSPLIFGSYATNVYYICMQLIDALTPDKVAHSLVHSIFAPWSFLHLIIRIFLISITAAKINTYAHEIGSILKKCPIEYYDAEVARVDKHVTAGPDIGLSGLGAFVLTKPFILSIVNVIFTVEIVLLQGLSSGTCSS